MGNFHEVLPGISVISNFYYKRTKESTYLNQTIEFSIKNYTSMEILSNGIELLYKTSREQAVGRNDWKKVPFAYFGKTIDHPY